MKVKSNRSTAYRFAIALTLIIFFGIHPPIAAQSPKHLQSFSLSPLQKGKFLLLDKKPDDALKVFQDLWQRQPNNNYAVRGIVQSHQALKKLPEAVSFLNEYLKKNSRSSSATYGLGYVFYLQGMFKESKGVLNESLSFDLKNTLALNTLAAVLVELKEYADALTRVKEAIQIAPNELMFYRNLQMIYASSGKPDHFEKEYRHLLGEGLSTQAKGYGLILAQQLRQKSFKSYVDGNISETFNAMRAMLDLYREVNHEPGIVAGLFSLAVLYEEQGNVDLALEKYQEVLKINPQHIQARQKLRALEVKGD